MASSRLYSYASSIFLFSSRCLSSLARSIGPTSLSLILGILIPLAILAPSLSAAPEPNDVASKIESLSVSELEDRRKLIEEELSQLASYSLRSGVGAIGYRSQANTTETAKEFVQINLETEATIDSIVLAPTIWRDTQSGFRADGFPSAFTIVAGTNGDHIGEVIATFESDFEASSRIAPLTIPCNGVTASWIRLETSRLLPRAFDGRFVLQLSEMLVFAGEENIALGKEVLASSRQDSSARAWDPKYLVDGALPYLMDAAIGDQSVSWVSRDFSKNASISIDLEGSHLLTRIILHTVDQSDTVPQAFAGDFGFPKHLTVEGANKADFSDAQLLLDFRRKSIFDVNPIVPLLLIQAKYRYVRLTAVEPYEVERLGENGQLGMNQYLGFAEIELLSRHRNVALGKSAFSSQGTFNPNRSIAALTDGNNLYGRILPLREWMRQLSRRHELELVLPIVEARLNRRYESQKANLRILSWIIAALVAGTIMMFLIDIFLRQRAIFKTKERIAADLHDELGANLHAIALLGDLAQATKDSPKKVSEHLERIRSLIKRTSESAKNCTNMLDTPGLYEDLIGEMKRSSRRITSDLNHELKFENEELIERIKPRKRIDLFLFYNECLVNIIRHSHATNVETHLFANSKTVSLTVRDNGNGLPHNSKVTPPPSLKRRAKLIGAQLFATNPESGGTLITLQMKLK